MEIAQLRRVNLVTGRNGTGKTTLLDALRLYADAGAWESLIEVMAERGQLRPGRDPWLAAQAFLTDVTGKRYFGSARLSAGDADREMSLGLSRDDGESTTEAPQEPGTFSHAYFSRAFAGTHLLMETQRVWNLNGGGGWSGGARPPAVVNRRVVPLQGLGVDRLCELWGEVEFTAAESEVVRALRILMPAIEKVSFRQNENRNGFWVAVKLAGRDGAVPMAALGDGVQRTFGLLLALHGARGGLLLVDEIDTGLHFRALEPMWALLIDEAQRVGAQIVATTHSEDAVRSLALAAVDRHAGEVAVIRLEHRGEERRAITFDDATSFAMIAAQGLEVR